MLRQLADGVSSTADESAEVETAAIGGEPAIDDAAHPGDDEDVEQDSQLTAAE